MSPALVPVIAIDGPAASGKGTVAARLAERLGFHYLDSGALYRLVAFVALQSNIRLDAAEALGALAARLPAQFRSGEPLVAGQAVGDAIRTEAISSAASQVAAYPEVRTALLQRQRDFRAPPGLVAEGRDMGTVVFPDAALKVFLTASAEVRAERRYKQLIKKGLGASIQDLLQDIRERDARDQSRVAAPLEPAADALMLDTSELSIEQVIEQVLALWGALK